MASINGVTVKALKSFKDHEGMDILQGNVYLNGKKLGFWSQDAWCGPDHFGFNEKLLADAVESYKQSDKVASEYKEIFNSELLMFELIKLIDAEKAYKKCVKAGYPILVMIESPVESKGWYLPNKAVLEKNLSQFEKIKSERQDSVLSIYDQDTEWDLVV